MSTYIIKIKGITAYAFHGVPDAEQSVGHQYRVNLEAEVQGTATDSDQITETVDYSAITSTVLSVLGEGQYRTIERIARLIADQVIERFAAVLKVEVEVQKPLPPMPFVVDSVSVVVTAQKPTAGL